jgi:hypothetical protein
MQRRILCQLKKINYSTKTSGTIVIADEVLTGKILDTNSHSLSKRKLKIILQSFIPKRN